MKTLNKDNILVIKTKNPSPLYYSEVNSMHAITNTEITHEQYISLESIENEIFSNHHDTDLVLEQWWKNPFTGIIIARFVCDFSNLPSTYLIKQNGAYELIKDDDKIVAHMFQ